MTKLVMLDIFSGVPNPVFQPAADLLDQVGDPGAAGEDETARLGYRGFRVVQTDDDVAAADAMTTETIGSFSRSALISGNPQLERALLDAAHQAGAIGDDIYHYAADAIGSGDGPLVASNDPPTNGTPDDGSDGASAGSGSSGDTTSSSGGDADPLAGDDTTGTPGTSDDAVASSASTIPSDDSSAGTSSSAETEAFVGARPLGISPASTGPAPIGTGGCPPCGGVDAPTYDAGYWNNDPVRQGANNCYAYANNQATNTFPQPGRGSGQQYTSLDCDGVRPASERDGLVTTSTFQASRAGWYVALVIWPGQDYHWYRQDASGCWSHKPGSTKVRDVDNAGQRITDPSQCDRGPYTVFCTFMVTNGSVTIK